MANLDVKAMDWARREADRLVFATNTIREMRDAIEAALLSAHEAGRAAGAEQMREAAAAVLDDMARGSAATLDMALFRSGAQAIRTLSFRALPLPAPPKESGS